MKTKRLYRTTGNDRLIGGVCGGICRSLGIDTTIVRLIWIFAAFIWGAGLFLYFLLWIIIPKEPAKIA